ncbi:MAG: hypothetical protein Q7T44_07155 [Parvibaculum sp.]|nr:hypothetical protein [Parvibaculum sp.]
MSQRKKGKEKMRTREQLIRAVAWVDLAITLPFVQPTIAYWLIGYIYHLDQQWMMLSIIPHFDPLTLMFVNIMGVLGVVWAIARLKSPTEDLARIDALARIIVAALIIHAITWGATPILWLFVATEVLGSAAQLIRRPPSSSPRESA